MVTSPRNKVGMCCTARHRKLFELFNQLFRAQACVRCLRQRPVIAGLESNTKGGFGGISLDLCTSDWMLWRAARTISVGQGGLERMRRSPSTGWSQSGLTSSCWELQLAERRTDVFRRRLLLHIPRGMTFCNPSEMSHGHCCCTAPDGGRTPSFLISAPVCPTASSSPFLCVSHTHARTHTNAHAHQLSLSYVLKKILKNILL